MYIPSGYRSSDPHLELEMFNVGIEIWVIIPRIEMLFRLHEVYIHHAIFFDLPLDFPLINSSISLRLKYQRS